MTDEKEQNQGLRVAHTPPENFPAAAPEPPTADPERAAKVGSTAAMTEAAMADLAQALAGGREEPAQQSLLLDEIDEQQSLFAGPVAHVASTIAEGRRARGRPKGSQNKASRDFAATLMRMGYRHPGLNLAALANADPVKLAEQLTIKVKDDKTGAETVHHCSPQDAMGMILKANAELLPYFESKQATKVEVEERQLGVMYIGRMPGEQQDDGPAMDLTKVPAPE